MVDAKRPRGVLVDLAGFGVLARDTSCHHFIVRRLLTRNVKLKIINLILVYKVVEFLIQATHNVVFGTRTRLAFELEHGGLCVLVKVPGEHDQHVPHRLPGNDLKPVALAGLVNLFNVDTFVEIDSSFHPLICLRRVVWSLGLITLAQGFVFATLIGD